jgi:hypothetical protein
MLVVIAKNEDKTVLASILRVEAGPLGSLIEIGEIQRSQGKDQLVAGGVSQPRLGERWLM